MTKDNWTGIGIIFGIIAIAIFGGKGGLSAPNTPDEQEALVVQQIADAQHKADDLQKQITTFKEEETHSVYFGKVSLQSVAQSTNPAQEYIILRATNSAGATIPITGWTLRSQSTGNVVQIPQGSYIYFDNSQNAEEDVNLSADDTVYLITGSSPIGVGFRINKCSGYQTQFHTFTPSLWTSCPAPRNEDTSSIKPIVANDACFDYINSFPSCRVPTDSLPNNWTYECKQFVTQKINYNSCITTHKNDKDFYSHEWRLYLKRSTTLWKNSREDIILYDLDGKIVSELTY